LFWLSLLSSSVVLCALGGKSAAVFFSATFFSAPNRRLAHDSRAQAIHTARALNPRLPRRISPFRAFLVWILRLPLRTPAPSAVNLFFQVAYFRA
jgi:hypothetical protein